MKNIDDREQNLGEFDVLAQAISMSIMPLKNWTKI